MRTLFLLFLSIFNLLLHPELYSQDKGLLPVPHKIALNDQRYTIDDSWSLSTNAISKTDPAVLSLTAELKERFNVRIKNSGTGNRIQLIVKPGSVNIGHTTDTNVVSLRKQAYRLSLKKGMITISANAGAGLFYGVQTLVQLLENKNGNIGYAAGEITDWPDMDLRMIYWDDAHHLERLDAMKRAIRQASYYKINAFTVKLEGHFQFSSAKPLVEPYAYTPAEFQELTDYAKQHYVELVPYIDAPAHISFILKHPEYADLRSFPNSNYEFSVVDPKADELLMGMIDELIQANAGGKYFFLSTDEAYYVGKSPAEEKRAKELGGNGRLLAEYITRITNKIHEKGRKVLIWGEYPLTPDDVTAIPSHIINAINGNSKEYGSRFKDHGIRHLAFTSAQGMEPLFPNYYRLPKKLSASDSLALTDDELQQGEMQKGRVNEILQTITSGVEAGKSDFMGTVVCGWADAGSNPETFWLGYATGMAASWNIKSADAKDLTNRFYRSFYGADANQMDRIYQLLSTQAEFWENSWEWKQSDHRTPIFGYSAAVFDTPKPAKDQVLPLLPIPSPNDLSIQDDWKNLNNEKLQLVEKFLNENDELMKKLHECLVSAQYQQYNLQVLHSVSQLCRQNLRMFIDLQKINELLILSSKTAGSAPSVSLSLIDQALDIVKKIRNERNETLNAVSTVWYQDWFPRVSEATGRKYVDKVDDVKDHPPVRTVDMSYLIYRQLNYPLGEWTEKVVESRNQFAKKNNLPLVNYTVDWQNAY